MQGSSSSACKALKILTDKPFAAIGIGARRNRNDRSKSKLAPYARRTAKLDSMQFISAQLGPFGELIGRSVQTEMARSQKIYMTFILKPEFHFGTDFEVSAMMDCGPINALGETIRKALNGLSNGDQIHKAIWPETITTICGQKNTLSTRVSFGWKVFAIDRAGTFLELKANSNTFKVSLADLPICPPGGSIGDSCSASTDCCSEDKDSDFAGYTQGQG